MINNADFEKMLANAAKRASEKEYQQLESDTKNYSYSFSAGFKSRIEALFNEQYDRYIASDLNTHVPHQIANRCSDRYKNLFKKKWKYILIAIIIVISAVTAFANEEFKTKIGSFFMNIFDHYVEFNYDSTESSSDYSLLQYKPAYIPEEYELEEESINAPVSYSILFRNNLDEKIYYRQYNKNITTNISISSENDDNKSVEIEYGNGCIISDKEIKTLFFELDDYVFMISGSKSLRDEELIKMANSIVK